MFLGLETLGYMNSCRLQQGLLELSESPELPSKKADHLILPAGDAVVDNPS